jgi:hypothetical protein
VLGPVTVGEAGCERMVTLHARDHVSSLKLSSQYERILKISCAIYFANKPWLCS